MTENTHRTQSKTTGTETEHYLNTERAVHSAVLIEKEEEDSFSLMSQTGPGRMCR